MDDSNGHYGRRRSDDLHPLRLGALLILLTVPVFGMVMDALGWWELTSEWVALYAIVAGATCTAFGLATWKR